ncbi:hypothetical protein E4T56_gene16414, partial [Termitomyces sp. T112]
MGLLYSFYSSRTDTPISKFAYKSICITASSAGLSALPGRHPLLRPCQGMWAKYNILMT